VMCGFVPLIRSGQEHEEREFIGRLLNARISHPALRYGTLRYNALPCSNPRIFAVLREHAGQQLVGLLNVGAHKQTVVVSVPVDQLGLAEGNYELYELFSQTLWAERDRRAWGRDELLALRLTLDPFAAYCFVVRSAVLESPTAGQPAPEAVESEAVTTALSLAETALSLGNGRRQDRRKREAS
jgi:hypothetical protein